MDVQLEGKMKQAEIKSLLQLIKVSRYRTLYDGYPGIAPQNFNGALFVESRILNGEIEPDVAKGLVKGAAEAVLHKLIAQGYVLSKKKHYGTHVWLNMNRLEEIRQMLEEAAES